MPARHEPPRAPLPTARFRVLAAAAAVLLAACAAETPSPAPVAGTTPSGIAWSARGAGPAVLLIHGTNLDRRVWDAVADDLASDHTVILYDLRSHGASVDATGPWSDLDDLAGVLEATGGASPVVVGLSAGAGIALEFALEHPEAVQGLVLVSPSVRGFVPRPGEIPEVFGPLMDAMGTGDTTAIADALLALPTFDAPVERRGTVEAMVGANLRLFGVDPAWARTPPEPPLERLDEVAVPTSVLVGDRDFAAVARLASELAQGIASAEFERVEGAPHLVPLSDPDRVARAVRALRPT